MSRFRRLDRLAGLGYHGVLLLGLDDVQTSTDFKHEVIKRPARKLLYVKPLSESSAKISTWETNVNSERYGYPVLYDVTIGKDPFDG